MSDEAVEPFAVQEIFFEGVTDLHIEQGMFKCILFSRQKAPGESAVHRVAIARLATPVSELPDIVQKFAIALTQAAKTIVKPILS